MPLTTVMEFLQWHTGSGGETEHSDQKTKGWQILSCFQDSHRDREALQALGSGSGGYLCYSVTRTTVPDGLSVTRAPPILVKMPPRWLVQDVLNPCCWRSQFATIQFQLQIFSSTRGFEAVQVWWLLCISWRGDAESRALHRYALFTYCLYVHLLMWRTDAAWFSYGGHNETWPA